MNAQNSRKASRAVARFIKNTGGELNDQETELLAILLTSNGEGYVRVSNHAYIRTILVGPKDQRSNQSWIRTTVAFHRFEYAENQLCKLWSALINAEIDHALKKT